jgi:hypothetical protein
MSEISTKTILPAGEPAPRVTASKRIQKSATPCKPAESKSALVLRLLARTRGATIAEIAEVTAWQAHSIRAFLSIQRKKGIALFHETRKDGKTAYRRGAAIPPAVPESSDMTPGMVA